MKKKRYKEEQIIRILKEIESGRPVAELCRTYGVSEQTIHRWRKRYGGLSLPDLKRLKALEAENSTLKRIVANQAVDIDALKFLLSKNS